MEQSAYGKMKQLLKWNDENIRMKMHAKEESRVRFYPRAHFLRAQFCWLTFNLCRFLVSQI
jgi:hypothetical protein